MGDTLSIVGNIKVVCLKKYFFFRGHTKYTYIINQKLVEILSFNVRDSLADFGQ